MKCQTDIDLSDLFPIERLIRKHPHAVLLIFTLLVALLGFAGSLDLPLP